MITLLPWFHFKKEWPQNNETVSFVLCSTSMSIFSWFPILQCLTLTLTYNGRFLSSVLIRVFRQPSRVGPKQNTIVASQRRRGPHSEQSFQWLHLLIVIDSSHFEFLAVRRLGWRPRYSRKASGWRRQRWALSSQRRVSTTRMPAEDGRCGSCPKLEPWCC